MSKFLKCKRTIALILSTMLSLTFLCGCGSSRSSSGKKYSDLSDVEKRNAKWAYEVQQGIKGK